MKIQKGYSMIVLVIAITVILILASSAISMLQVSREKTAITNFIFDITTVEEEIQDFYTSTGTLPVKTYENVDMQALNTNEAKGILSQLYVYDNDNYYDVDLSQLGTISVKDSERGYIVNEGSLKVYVKNGVEYKNFEFGDSGDSGDIDGDKTIYYTLTSNLVNGLEQYTSQDEEMLVIGNPITWTNEADLRLVLPQKSLEAVGADSWKDWKFKWDFGPKTVEELAAIPDSNSAKNFEYGDILKVKSNGIYSIYAKDPDGKETVLNVNVTKIDDISPIYKFITAGTETQIQAIDNETGIKSIKYKTLKTYNTNKTEAENNLTEDLEGRTNIDYYLLDGTGKDLLYDLAAEIDTYKTEKNTIQRAIEDEQDRYSRWFAENDMSLLTPEEIEAENSNYNNRITDLNNQLTALYQKYPYLYDIYGKTEDSRLVIYIEDNAGNATVCGERDFISLEILANSYNISLEGLK